MTLMSNILLAAAGVTFVCLKVALIGGLGLAVLWAAGRAWDHLTTSHKHPEERTRP